MPLWWPFFLLVGCGNQPPEEGSDTGRSDLLSRVSSEVMDRILDMGPLGPMPEDPTNRWADSLEAATFGQHLYFDNRLSLDGTVSCASCHNPEHAGADRSPTRDGIGTGVLNAPTTWNAGYQRWFFWNGRADSLWAQALGPLENQREHASNRTDIARLVSNDPQLKTMYEDLFGSLPDLSDTNRFPSGAKPDTADTSAMNAWSSMDALDQETVTEVFVHVGKSLAAYQGKLVLGPIRLDTFLDEYRTSGEIPPGTLDASEIRGLILFADHGQCHFCHAGPLFSNREFHNIGLASDTVDYGRFQGITQLLESEFNGASVWSDSPDYGASRILPLVQSDEQLGQFRTPSLRNVSRTAPYMHDGTRANLEQVVAFYNEMSETSPFGHREELLEPLYLSEQDRKDLVAFLTTLDADPPENSWTQAP